MKQYVGFVRDHSRSMQGITRGAAKDYNTNLKAVQDAAKETGLDTILTVVKCGVGSDARVVREVVNSNVFVVEQLGLNAYEASGSGTPLFDSVNETISLMQQVPDANEKDVTFLVMVTTDGQENRSSYGAKERMLENFKKLQATDRWTFVFRVPRGDKHVLRSFGVPEGNILEWDQTEAGVEASSQITASAVSSYFTGVSRGIQSTGKFYANLDHVSQTQVKKTLTDVSKNINCYIKVESWHPVVIKEFAEKLMNGFLQGCIYYQLTKAEKVQANKKIVIRNQVNGHYYAGKEARDLLGLPDYEVKVYPGQLSDYDVFVQSTSLNRKLVVGTWVLKYIG